jgi:hypothetical protein
VLCREDLDDIKCEVINVTDDIDEANLCFEGLIENENITPPPKKPYTEAIFMDEDEINLFKIQLHGFNLEYTMTPTIMDDFIDGSDESNEVDTEDGNLTMGFLNYKPNMNPREIDSYMNKVSNITKESKKQTENITEKYNKVISKNGKMLEEKKGKNLTLKFSL